LSCRERDAPPLFRRIIGAVYLVLGAHRRLPINALPGNVKPFRALVFTPPAPPPHPDRLRQSGNTFGQCLHPVKNLSGQIF
jgi:hypothetical protein